jgi:hypothetical protein
MLVSRVDQSTKRLVQDREKVARRLADAKAMPSRTLGILSEPCTRNTGKTIPEEPLGTILLPLSSKHSYHASRGATRGWGVYNHGVSDFQLQA